MGNPGASTVHGYSTQRQPNTYDIDAVMVDDLFDLPEEQRPKIRVGVRRAGTSHLGEEDPTAFDYSEVPLQRHHVHMVKVDVEGFDIVAAHGMRKLLDGRSADERPMALTFEFQPSSRTLGCNPFSFAQHLYELGYTYEGKTLEDMWAAMVAKNVPGGGTLEDWWARSIVLESKAAVRRRRR
jgi:hypothetical protein